MPARARTALVTVVTVAALAAAGCGRPDGPSEPGANVNADPNSVFSQLMRRPDIDQATRRYEQLGADLRQALTEAIPTLSPWVQDGDTMNAGCGADYPGIGWDGVTRDLPGYVVAGNLPDDKYEQALQIVGSVAEKYGFNPSPQRLHDAPGSHDAMFHNVHDDGGIFFGTAKNTTFSLSIGCHLTAAAKKRGHLSPPPTY